MNLTMGDVGLRYAKVDDAAFILQLRSTAVARQTLSTGAASIDAQAQWLSAYKEREDRGLEHYFVISYRKQPVGAVRIYDIQPSEGTFTWGSWAIQANTPPLVAWITVVLLYDFAFARLGLALAKFEVVDTNQNVIRFHQGFGAVSDGTSGNHVCFILPKNAYDAIRARFLQRIELAAS